MTYTATGKPSDAPGPIVDGWRVVSWGNRPWLLVAFALVWPAGLVSLWWPGTHTHERGLGVITVFLLTLTAFFLANAWFYARQRFRYRDDTLICTSLWGGSREFRISELRSIGFESVRGTQIITPHGENIYINKYQPGALVLIELITGKKDPDHPDDAEWLRE
jgi:hypothetical protein